MSLFQLSQNCLVLPNVSKLSRFLCSAGRGESISTSFAHFYPCLWFKTSMQTCVRDMTVRFKKDLKQSGCIGIINMALCPASWFTISLSGTYLRGSAGCCMYDAFPAKGCYSLPWGHKEVQRQIKWQQSATAAQFLQHRSNCSLLL